MSYIMLFIPYSPFAPINKFTITYIPWSNQDTQHKEAEGGRERDRRHDSHHQFAIYSNRFKCNVDILATHILKEGVIGI